MHSSFAIPRHSSPADIPDWLARRLPAGRDLSLPELRALAEAIGAERPLWQALVRHDLPERHYSQLYHDVHVDVWLLCWTAEQDTGFHDHDRSAGAVFVCEGELAEDRFELSDSVIKRVSVPRRAGRSFAFDASHVHRVRHAGRADRPATSLHVYSPALWRMGYYDTNPAGLLRRVSVTYAEELAS